PVEHSAHRRVMADAPDLEQLRLVEERVRRPGDRVLERGPHMHDGNGRERDREQENEGSTPLHLPQLSRPRGRATRIGSRENPLARWLVLVQLAERGSFTCQVVPRIRPWPGALW